MKRRKKGDGFFIVLVIALLAAAVFCAVARFTITQNLLEKNGIDPEWALVLMR